MSPENRLKALREAPPGDWVAFSEDEERVVAYASTYEEAVARAEGQGVAEPVLVKVSKDWTEIVLTN